MSGVLTPERLQEDQDTIRLHWAAQNVLRSLGGGGRGSFRVDDVDEQLAASLPGYMGHFVGEYFPSLYHDEQGVLRLNPTRLVRPEDTLFRAERFWSDENTGISMGWFRWDLPGEEPLIVGSTGSESIPSTEGPSMSRRDKIILYSGGLVGVSLEVAGFADHLNPWLFGAGMITAAGGIIGSLAGDLVETFRPRQTDS